MHTIILKSLVFLLLTSLVVVNGHAQVGTYKKYVDSPYGQIHARVAVPSNTKDISYPPLVLLHYSPGSSRMYEHVLPLLASDRLVIAIDTPGYGQSDVPLSQPELGDYTDAIMAALSQLTNAAQFDVYGQLTGSLIAVDMAVRYEAKVRRVVLSRSPVFTEQERTEYLDRMRKLHASRIADRKGDWMVEKLQKGLAKLEPSVTPDHYVGPFIDNISSGHDWVLGEIAAISYRADLAMPKISQKVGVVMWTSSDGTSTMGGASLRSLEIIKGATPIDINSPSYWVYQDHPDVVAKAIREFLK